MFATNPLGVVILLIDLDLIGKLRNVRHVDLHRAVAQCFHELVVLKLAILRFVRMADNHFVDVGLRELLRLDFMFLACAEQVVQERDFEFQNFDELDDAAVRNIELAVEIERPGIRVRTVDRDLAIVDVAREFGRVLVLFILRLEGSNADPVFFGEHQSANFHVIHDLEPVAFVAAHQLSIHLPACGAEVAFDLDREVRVAAVAHELVDQLAALIRRNQMQRLFAHRTRQFVVDERKNFLLDIVRDIRPRKRVHRAFRPLGVFFEALLEEAHDRTLRAADRPVQQDDAMFGAVIPGGRLEDVDQMIKALIDSIDGVAPIVTVVAEEAVSSDLLFVFEVVVHPVGEDHVVNPLERIPRDPRIFLNQFEVVLKRALPIEFLVFLRALQVRHGAENIYGLCLVMHTFHLVFLPAKKKDRK